MKFTGNPYSYVCERPPLKYTQTHVCQNSYTRTLYSAGLVLMFMWTQPKAGHIHLCQIAGNPTWQVMLHSSVMGFLLRAIHHLYFFYLYSELVSCLYRFSWDLWRVRPWLIHSLLFNWCSKLAQRSSLMSLMLTVWYVLATALLEWVSKYPVQAYTTLDSAVSYLAFPGTVFAIYWCILASRSNWQYSLCNLNVFQVR